MTYLKTKMDMTGRKVVITGGAGHLGRVMADTLAEMGAEILLVDRPGAGADEAARQLTERHENRAEALECDLESEAQRTALCDRLQEEQALSCLINNAAFVGASNLEGWSTPFEEQSVESWRRALEVNLTACFELSRRLTPLLRKGAGGNILNIASIYGQWGPDWSLYEGTAMANPAAYGASKGGLIQLTKWLATTLAPDIRVNAISPGGLARGQDAEFVERYVARTPMQRMAVEDDFRGAVAYLASDLSAYVTGHTLPVDGGWGSW